MNVSRVSVQAGSENQKTSKSQSQLQFGESCGINLSLTYLGPMIREAVGFRVASCAHGLEWGALRALVVRWWGGQHSCCGFVSNRRKGENSSNTATRS